MGRGWHGGGASVGRGEGGAAAVLDPSIPIGEKSSASYSDPRADVPFALLLPMLILNLPPFHVHRSTVSP